MGRAAIVTGAWYRHGWNRELSWRLIHAIIPWVPRPLRPPIHLVTTGLCFAAMPAERRAARRNLGRVLGRPGDAGLLPAFRLFYNFSKFMVAYTDLVRHRPGSDGRRIEGGDEAAARIRALLAGGRGLVVATLHLGQWEKGLASLSGLEVPVTVVLRPEEGAPGRFEARARSRPGLRVVPVGDSAWNGLDLLLALRRGGIVAVQIDRAFGPPTCRVDLFGAPFDLPAGPFALARAAGAPILLGAFPIRGHARFGVLLEGPFRVGEGEQGIGAVAAELAGRIEAIIARHPTQWFNFYDVWGDRSCRAPSAGSNPRTPRPAGS